MSRQLATPTSPIRVMDLRGTYKGGGGPDKTILNSAAQHDKRRVDVLVTYLRDPNDYEFGITNWAKELRINYVEVLDRKVLDLKCLLELSGLIIKHDIQLLHTHDDKTLLYGCLLKVRIPGIKLMHTCHSHAEYSRDTFSSLCNYFKFRLRKRFLIFLMNKHKKPIITISENTRQRLISGGLVPEHVTVLYNGIDTEYWQRKGIRPVLRKELKIKDNEFLVGTVARITYDKDLPTFYKVAQLVLEENPAVKFVIVGDGYGNELQEAKDQVASLGLDKIIHFTGHRTDLREIYSSLDIFLITSLTEGMPNTVLEAMALEVPVVATDVGGVPELMGNGKTGILCKTKSHKNMTSALLKLMDDKILRINFATSSRQRIEKKFSFTKRLQKMEQFYAELATSPKTV